MTDKTFLDKAYDLDGPDKTRDFYADWAATYDAEIAKNGYATPARCAAALMGAGADITAPLLDIGCGTGISGAALHSAGFTTLDGCDMTPEMLEGAKARGIYRNLWVNDPDGSLNYDNGPYPLVAAIGVMGAGAARMVLFDDITARMQSGDLFVFSFNDHTLEDPSYEAAVTALVADGGFELLFKEYGPHLPKRDMKSNVYVLKKT